MDICFIRAATDGCDVFPPIFILHVDERIKDGLDVVRGRSYHASLIERSPFYEGGLMIG
jgi:hypothetical protein